MTAALEAMGNKKDTFYTLSVFKDWVKGFPEYAVDLLASVLACVLNQKKPNDLVKRQMLENLHFLIQTKSEPVTKGLQNR